MEFMKITPCSFVLELGRWDQAIIVDAQQGAFMKQKLGWVCLVLLLAIFAPVSPALSDDPAWDPFATQNKGGDVLNQMKSEGWRVVAPGVMQRRGSDNQIETFAVGPEGLRWGIKELRARLAFLRKEHRIYGTDEIRKAIVSYQKQIAKLQRDLARAKDLEPESLESAVEKVGCSVSYGSSSTAGHLTNTAGTTATASANFTNTCGYSAETYAYAYARATRNTLTETFSQTDPRTGTNITSSAVATVQGGPDCYSEAYSYARYAAANIFLSFSDSHSSCPTPNNPTVTISGTTYEYFSSAGCQSRTWTATVSNGTSPYTYQWFYGNGTTAVGTGATYTRSVCPGNAPGFDLKVTVTDSGGVSASDTHFVYVEYDPQPMCGQYYC
jgi:hypothetical protein